MATYNTVGPIKRALQRLPERLEKRMIFMSKAALAEISSEVLEKAKEYVPYDTGDLQASGRVVAPNELGKGVKAGVEFGGGKVDYAFYVHENMPRDRRFAGPAAQAVTTSTGEQIEVEGNYKEYKTPGTGPKYLERAVFEVFTKENLEEKLRKRKPTRL